MRVVLTGATGMVGRALQRAFDRLRPDAELMAPSRRELDLLDAADVHRFIGEAAPDLVIHCAGRVGGIAANVSDPLGFLLENGEMGFNVVRAALSAKVRTLLNIGTSCMYPRDRDVALKEDDLLCGPLEPTNEGYAVGKIAVAKACEYASHQHAVSYRTIVPPNMYGPDDHFNANRSHLIAAILLKLHTAISEGSNEVDIWGDGTARREFLYTDDLAEFVVANMNAIPDWPGYMNIGYGEDFQVAEYYRWGAEVTGFAGTFRHDLTKPAGMRRKLLDSARARAFGWAPVTAPLDGMHRTYEALQSGSVRS